MIGLERVPASGPVLLCPIHVSHVDPAAVGCSSPRQLAFMAKAELFRVPIFGPLISSVGCFPVDRGRSGVSSLRKAVDVLDRGGALLVFPEGRRGDGERLQSLEPGVVALAKRDGVRVVPVAIAGSARMLPKGSSRPRRTRVTVRYGEPFTFQEATEGSNEPKQAFLERLAQELENGQAELGQPFKTGSAKSPGPAGPASLPATED